MRLRITKRPAQLLQSMKHSDKITANAGDMLTVSQASRRTQKVRRRWRTNYISNSTQRTAISAIVHRTDTGTTKRRVYDAAVVKQRLIATIISDGIRP